MKIDVTEKFDHLPRAPIVEAAIEIRARAEAPWDEKIITDQFKAKLPDYPKAISKSTTKHELKLEAGQPAKATEQYLGWQGLVCQSADGLQVAQFYREGFTFSRVQPYTKWDDLFGETMRLWNIHRVIAKPIEANRIGLRFINRIVLPLEAKPNDYIQPYPESPRGLESAFYGFFHQETIAVPGYPYAMNFTRATQQPQDPQREGISLILDIDVFTTKSFDLADDIIVSRLNEMRWLKNKAFFGSVTARALEMFK